MSAPRTLYDKIWDDHVVHQAEDGTCLLYIDRHLVHEVTSPQAFEGLRMTGRKVRAPEKTIAVPDQMLPRRGPNYALRVQGTSMIDEHILDGDVVVVHGKQSAENGEMVIALVNGSEATVKKFYRESGGWIRLQPANSTMQPMRFQERDVLIQGVVVGVIRKY